MFLALNLQLLLTILLVALSREKVGMCREWARACELR